MPKLYWDDAHQSTQPDGGFADLYTTFTLSWHDDEASTFLTVFIWFALRRRHRAGE